MDQRFTEVDPVHDLQFSEFERQVETCLRSSSGWPRMAAYHSLRHLSLASRLRELDPEMAILRAITAEEEAATALLAILLERQYKGVKEFHCRNHRYKQGLWFLIEAIRVFLGKQEKLPAAKLLLVEENDVARMTIGLKHPVKNGYFFLDPPLCFNVTDVPGGDLSRFDAEFKELATRAGRGSLQEHIGREAKFRDFLLYASAGGMPRLVGQPVEGEIARRRSRVFDILFVFCLIFPYAKRANFVQQALDAYLGAMQSTPKNST